MSDLHDRIIQADAVVEARLNFEQVIGEHNRCVDDPESSAKERQARYAARERGYRLLALAAAREALRIAKRYLRHDDDCDAAAWEQRNKAHRPNYERPVCTCGLDDLLSSLGAQEQDSVSVSVPASSAPHAAPCLNCGHADAHNGYAGGGDGDDGCNDACTHEGCNCGWYTPAVTTETLPKCEHEYGFPIGKPRMAPCRKCGAWKTFDDAPEHYASLERPRCPTCKNVTTVSQLLQYGSCCFCSEDAPYDSGSGTQDASAERAPERAGSQAQRSHSQTINRPRQEQEKER